VQSINTRAMKCLQSKHCLWGLPFLLSLIVVAPAETERIVDPRPGFETSLLTEDNLFVPQPRIIGGSNARQDRYPYFVSLVDFTGAHTCGGSLVAPDIVLTAGHCQGATRRAHVGRWNRQDGNGDDYDDIAIEFPEYPHPEYSDEGFPNDFMIVKLSRQSSEPIVMLNGNPNLPRGNVEDEVTVIGFGNTVSGVTSLATILQEVDLGYIPNPVCELSKDSRLDLSYQNQIIDSMLCAGDLGEDSCQGDSGGPLIIGGGSAEQDVIVGLISWYVPV
jgi:transmembrane serine protease 13